MFQGRARIWVARAYPHRTRGRPDDKLAHCDAKITLNCFGDLGRHDQARKTDLNESNRDLDSSKHHTVDSHDFIVVQEVAERDDLAAVAARGLGVNGSAISRCAGILSSARSDEIVGRDIAQFWLFLLILNSI